MRCHAGTFHDLSSLWDFSFFLSFLSSFIHSYLSPFLLHNFHSLNAICVSIVHIIITIIILHKHLFLLHSIRLLSISVWQYYFHLMLIRLQQFMTLWIDYKKRTSISVKVREMTEYVYYHEEIQKLMFLLERLEVKYNFRNIEFSSTQSNNDFLQN